MSEREEPKPGDRLRWISKSTHPRCIGIVAVYLGEGKVDLPWEQVLERDSSMGPNWGTHSWHWYELAENEFGEVIP